MRLKYKFAIQKLGNKFVAVTVDDDAGKFNGVIKVNELGMEILKVLQEETDKEMIIKSIKGYPGSYEELGRQVDTFLEELGKSGLLVC